jgi:uncharacterized OB-fold protein
MAFATPVGYKATCEHCGSIVPVANVCPKCGREHTSEWKTQQKGEVSSMDTVAVIALVLIGVLYFFG